ncbi:MAG: class I SAM-dependent methyltransferase [Paracoccaceae bacterium]
MTPLHALMARRIARAGPMTLAEYMGMALGHPEHGYYATRDPFGAAGDFVTAPETSQMFGELIGLALAQAWLDQGSPAPFALVELGPGRGTLMADALRAARGVPGWRDAARLHLVETSPVLRAVQAEALPDATFHDHQASLPDLPTFAVANEFLDALPARQAVRAGDLWRERMVTLDGDRLAFALAPAAPIPALAHRSDVAEGELTSWHPALPALISDLGARIAAHGGVALLIDYGDAPPRGDTLQAVARHAPADPLTAPGEADLTVHVDFAEIARHAAPAVASAPTPQGAFLARLGIGARAEALARAMDAPAREAHADALDRLTSPARMGTLFKVMALTPPGAPPVPGVDPGSTEQDQTP